MHSLPAIYLKRFLDRLRTSPAARIGALAVVVGLAAIVGPQGLAIGPGQSHANTPALPTGGAMDTYVVLASIPVSFETIPDGDGRLETDHGYPLQEVGPLRFPLGAIDVPWDQGTHIMAGPSDLQAPEIASQGGNVSTPSLNASPRVMPAAFVDRGADLSVADLIGDTNSIVLFDRGGADLNGEAEDILDNLAAILRGNDERIQLRAFGGNMADRTHVARRLALRRALSVRNHLMDHGIDQERITVRAMGGATDGGPSDRVDVVFADSF
jgi:outer membrane protein OmpA-like peptidoglycan-associated protein